MEEIKRKAPTKQDIADMLLNYGRCAKCDTKFTAYDRYITIRFERTPIPYHQECCEHIKDTFVVDKPLKSDLHYMLKHYGVCALSGEKLNGYYEADHVEQLWLSNRNKGNFRPLTKQAHRERTDEDATFRAKVRRLQGRTGQKARREKNGPQIESNRKLESRSGFGDNKGLKSNNAFPDKENKWPSKPFGSRGWEK